MWQRFGRLGSAAEFWRVFTELNPETIRAEAERPFRMAILGAPGSGKSTLASALAGSRENDEVGALYEGHDLVGALRGCDLSVYLIDATERVSGEDQEAVRRLGASGRAFVVIINKLDAVDDRDRARCEAQIRLAGLPADKVAFGSATRGKDVEAVFVPTILAAAPSLFLALPRRLSVFRQTVADDIIAETARVNAEFALLSSLPANIPFVGGLIGGSADFLVLTKNQAMMTFKLAAIHDRDLTSKLRLAGELVPVVGAAFLWRTAAREVVGMLPTFVAAAPKTAIAYIGTYVVGKMAQYYFSLGTRPTAAMVREFSDEAIQHFRRLAVWPPRAIKGGLWPGRRVLEGK